LCRFQEPILFDNTSQQEHFIIKEIDINRLRDKYGKHKIEQSKFIKRTYDPHITPYEKQALRPSEQDYYEKKIKGLVKSEIEALRLATHDNIVQFYDWTREDNIYFLKMEYCDLGDVYSFLKTDRQAKNVYGGLDFDLVSKFVEDICEAFIYLDNQNIIHRDCKLQNILMKSGSNKDVIFKLSDFGFACYDQSTHLSSNNSEMTNKYYKLCGTPYFMAPELILNMRRFQKDNIEPFYGKAVDMWSYGLCIYEVIFNKLPFVKITSLDDLEKYYKTVTQHGLNSKNKCYLKFYEDLLCGLLDLNVHSRYTAYGVRNELIKRHHRRQPIMTTSNQHLQAELKSTIEEELELDLDDYMIEDLQTNKKEVYYPENSTSSWEHILVGTSNLFRRLNLTNTFMNWLFEKVT
jgi:serine/threonine protein kinase